MVNFTLNINTHRQGRKFVQEVANYAYPGLPVLTISLSKYCYFWFVLYSLNVTNSTLIIVSNGKSHDTNVKYHKYTYVSKLIHLLSVILTSLFVNCHTYNQLY